MWRLDRASCRTVMLGLALGLVAPGGVDGAADGDRDDETEAPRVVAPDVPERGVREMRLEEIWRVGGEDDETVLLGLVGDVEVGPDGNFYVLDTQLSQVQVLAPDGQYLRTIGGPGEGPGEFTRAMEMAFLPDGSLGVAQAFPGRLVGLLPDGSPHDNVEITGGPSGGFAFLTSVRQGGGVTLVSTTVLSYDQDAGQTVVRPEIFSCDPDGRRKVSYWRNEFRIATGVKDKATEALFDTPDRRYAVGADGRVAMAPARNEYAIHVYDRTGRLERCIERPHESWRRNAMATSYARFFAAQIGRAFQVKHVVLEETEPDIAELRWAPDGALWVMTSRALYQRAPGVFCEFDVFSPAGRYLEKLRVMLDADPRLDLLLFPDSDHALVVRGYMDAQLGMMGSRRHGTAKDEAQPLELVCYRIL